MSTRISPNRQLFGLADSEELRGPEGLGSVDVSTCKSQARCQWSRFWSRALQLLAFISLTFPKDEEKAFFKDEARNRIKLVQAVSTLHIAYIVISFILQLLLTGSIRFRVGTEFPSDAEMWAAAEDSLQVKVVLNCICAMILTTSLWQIVMPFVRPAHAFFLDHPWAHYLLTWFWNWLLSMLLMWEVHVRQDAMFTFLVIVIVQSFMCGIFLFRHVMYWGLGSTVFIFAIAPHFGFKLTILPYEPFITPILYFVTGLWWASERQKRQLFLAHVALARETAARARGEKAAQDAQAEAEAAKVDADSARESESRFMARMSHEIRTPLSGLLGFLDLLGKCRLSKDQQEIYSSMSSAGLLLKATVNDILDSAKLQAGMIQLDFHTRSLRHTIDSTVTIFRGLLQPKGLSCQVHISDSLETEVSLDHVRVQQMLSNLLSNAIKFTEKGGLSIRMTPDVSAEGKDLVKVEVQDTGIGVPPEKIDCLFKDFTQVDESVSRKYGGTGLGLSMVRRMAVLMGGNAGVSSVIGEGSCFWFTAELHASPTPQPSALPKEPIVPWPGGYRIMVVDDTPILLKMMQHQMEHFGVQGVFISSGKQALEYLQAVSEAELPGFVLMDVWMPEMDGIMTTQAILQLWPQLVVVGLTGDTAANTEQKAPPPLPFIPSIPLSPCADHAHCPGWYPGVGGRGEVWNLLASPGRREVGAEYPLVWSCCSYTLSVSQGMKKGTWSYHHIMLSSRIDRNGSSPCSSPYPVDPPSGDRIPVYGLNTAGKGYCSGSEDVGSNPGCWFRPPKRMFIRQHFHGFCCRLSFVADDVPLLNHSSIFAHVFLGGVL